MNTSTAHKMMATTLVLLMLIQLIQLGASSLSPNIQEVHLHSIDDAITASLMLPFTTSDQQQTPCSNSADAEKESELNTTDEFIPQKGIGIPFSSAHTYELLKVATLTLFADPITPPPRA